MRTLYRILAGVAVVPPALLVAQGKPQAPALDDAAMIGIFASANTWNIETGSLAATRAARQDVKDFGALLVKDHQDVLDSARALATKLKVSPTPAAADYPLKVAHEAAMLRLKGLDGAAFDSAFLEHEAAYHKAFIEAVNKSFLPTMKSVDYKIFLEKIAPACVAHQVAAEELLKKKPSERGHR